MRLAGDSSLDLAQGSIFEAQSVDLQPVHIVVSAALERAAKAEHDKRLDASAKPAIHVVNGLTLDRRVVRLDEAHIGNAQICRRLRVVKPEPELSKGVDLEADRS